MKQKQSLVERVLMALRSGQVAGLDDVPPVVRRVVALLSVAHFPENPPLFIILRLALQPQTLALSVLLPVLLSEGALQRRNLRDTGRLY